MIARCLLLLALASPVLAERSSIEFVGIASNASTTKFAFHNTATGDSRWLSVGATFGDYTVSAYDPSTQTATLVKGGATLQLRLTAVQIEAPAAITPTTRAQAENIFMNLRFICAALDRYRLETGRSSASYQDLSGHSKSLQETVHPVAGESYDSLAYDPKHTVLSVTTAAGDVVAYDTETATAAPNSAFYILQPRDTGAKIALARGLSIADLLALNEGVNFNKLHVGELLRVRK